MHLITGPRRAVALSIAQDVAARLAARPAGQEIVAAGDLGFVPLFAALDQVQPDSEWDSAGRRILRRILTGGVFRVPDKSPGLFTGGPAGLGVAVALLGGGRSGLLTRLDSLVAPTAEHDLISGAAGAGVYLLLRPPSPDREAALARALARGARSDPPFPVPRHRIPAGWAVRDGYTDCGLAHGAAGPLAVLSLLAGRTDAAAEIARPAVARLADWLLGVAHRDEWGTAWPAGVAGDERYPSPRRASWCYGVPGIARALWLAGEALDEPAHRRAAQEAMDELLASPQAWGSTGSGCATAWPG